MGVASKQEAGVESSEAFKRLFSDFLVPLQALDSALPYSLATLRAHDSALREHASRFLKKHGKRKDGKIQYRVDASNYAEAGTFKRTLTALGKAEDIYIQSLYIGIFSRYDALIRALCSYILSNRSDLSFLNARNLTAAEVLNAASIEDVRQSLIAEYVDGVLRQSYTDQLKAISRDFHLTLDPSKVSMWPAFIEASQRRHVIVHCDSMVSRDYLANCKAASYSWPSGEPAVGAQLKVCADDVFEVIGLVAEVGLRLAYAVLGQVFKKRTGELNLSFSEVVYHFLEDEHWKLAESLGRFALSHKQVNTEARLRLVINTAQAIKWDGRDNDSRKLLDSEDWSAANDRFLIALACLRDQFQETSDLIRRQLSTEKDRNVWRQNVVYWPLFRSFREDESCHRLFEEELGGSMDAVAVPKKRVKRGTADIDVLPDHLDMIETYITRLSRTRSLD